MKAFCTKVETVGKGKEKHIKLTMVAPEGTRLADVSDFDDQEVDVALERPSVPLSVAERVFFDVMLNAVRSLELSKEAFFEEIGTEGGSEDYNPRFGPPEEEPPHCYRFNKNCEPTVCSIAKEIKMLIEHPEACSHRKEGHTSDDISPIGPPEEDEEPQGDLEDQLEKAIDNTDYEGPER